MAHGDTLGPVSTLLAAVPSAPPTPGRVLGVWSVDWSLVVVGVVALLYLSGVRRLAERGRRWPVARLACFVGGLAVLLVALDSGIGTYDTTRFSLHVVQHLLLGMVAPVLLVLGAPITLALQASRRPSQRRLLRVLHSGPVRVVTHPLVVWVAFAGTLVVLYFTGLYALTLRDPLVHDLVHVHFVVVGCLFAGYVVGVDPLPHALPYGARAIFVAVMLPFHAFLGVALLGRHTVIAASWYSHSAPAWAAGTALADQRTGAGVLWAFGELFGLVALGIVFGQWMSHEERVARREDARRSGSGSPLATGGEAGAGAHVG
jgi:putative membrane protein